MADSHGSTPAAWTAVGIVLLAFVVGGIALISPIKWWLFWIAVALLVVAALAAKVMTAMGIGESETAHRDDVEQRG